MAMCRLADRSALLTLRFNLGDRVRRMVRLTLYPLHARNSRMGDSDTSFTESLGRSDPIAPSLRRTRMESSGYRIVDLHRVRPLGNLFIL